VHGSQATLNAGVDHLEVYKLVVPGVEFNKNPIAFAFQTHLYSSHLTSQMDAFSTIINVFSTDSTVGREDVPVEFETGGGSGGSQCIIA